MDYQRQAGEKPAYLGLAQIALVTGPELDGLCQVCVENDVLHWNASTRCVDLWKREK